MNPASHSPQLRRKPAPPHAHLSKPRSNVAIPPIQPWQRLPIFEQHPQPPAEPSFRPHAVPVPAAVLRHRSANILRPTVDCFDSEPILKISPHTHKPTLMTANQASVPFPAAPAVSCDHECGCGRLAQVARPRTAEPHIPMKKRLLKEMKRVFMRPADTCRPTESAPKAVARSQSSQHGQTEPGTKPRTASAEPSLNTPPDHLPLTGIPLCLSPAVLSPATTISYEARFGSRDLPFQLNRSFPEVRFDIVPNATPMTVSERKASYLRDISKEVALVTTPSIRAGRRESVAAIRARYEERAKARQAVPAVTCTKLGTGLDGAVVSLRPWPPLRPARRPALPTDTRIPRNAEPSPSSPRQIRMPLPCR